MSRRVGDLILDMNYTISFDTEFRGVAVATSGVAQADGFAALLSDVAVDPGYAPGMPLLIDRVEIDRSTLPPVALAEVGDYINDCADDLGVSPIAVVVPTPDAAALGRLAQERVNNHIRIRFFHTREEAVRWLGTTLRRIR